MPTFQVKRSRHFNARPPATRPRLIVLHADASPTEEVTINWLLNPKSEVSYHYLIGRDGSTTQFVPDEERAWHAGVSSWAGDSDCNDFAIGVSFSNRQDGREPFPEPQIARGVELVATLMKAHGIGLDAITTHEQIARPMGRRQDPGPLFPLASFITRVRRKLAEMSR